MYITEQLKIIRLTGLKKKKKNKKTIQVDGATPQ